MSELVAQFEVRYPRGASIRADIRCPANGFSVTALIGSSGCGKTTVLRSLAGLEQPQRGRITFAEEVWFDAERGVARSPQQRNIGFLSQEYALFPHLTVAQNVEYGLRPLNAPDRQKQCGNLLQRFGLTGFEQRYPHQISGGQQQRVALARVLARKPRLLLLDEPLSSLDTPLREAMRRELRNLLADFGVPLILVTHDRHEAFALADQLIVMDAGNVLQSGPVLDVFARPNSKQVAHLVGVETVLSARIMDRKEGTVRVHVGEVQLHAVAGRDLPDDVFACIRAEDVELTAATTPTEGFHNQLSARIVHFALDGTAMRVELDCGFPLVASLPRPAFNRLSLEVGKTVGVQLAASSVHLVPKS